MKEYTLNDRLSRVYRILFWIVSVAIVAVCVPRAWDLRLLYTDGMVRTQVDTALDTLTESRGWLLSDLSIRAVHPDRVRVVHRAHVRGADPSECIDVFFESDRAAPCAD